MTMSTMATVEDLFRAMRETSAREVCAGMGPLHHSLLG